jgi:hypothetical protein
MARETSTGTAVKRGQKGSHQAARRTVIKNTMSNRKLRFLPDPADPGLLA